MESEDIYDRVYREMNPRIFPYSPWERQRQLCDLWPSEQKKFKDMVDAVAKSLDRD